MPQKKPITTSRRIESMPQKLTAQNSTKFSVLYSSQLLSRIKKIAPFLAVFILGLLPGTYFYHLGKHAGQTAILTHNTSLKTTTEIVNQVSRHILLPSGEQPTVATVTDASKVRNQAFFANAASGDKVLVYAQAKKAYLYRPTIDRIIEVAPLAPNQNTAAGQESTTP